MNCLSLLIYSIESAKVGSIGKLPAKFTQITTMVNASHVIE
jgi:hypothetical protein